MTPHPRLFLAFAILFALVAARGADAGPLTEQLKAAIDQVRNTLDDPALKAKEKTKDRRQAIRALTNGIFDWIEMAKQSLGSHWQARSDTDRGEFVTLFHDLLERSYISQIERYSGEKIVYASEAIDTGRATVRITIITKQGEEVPIDYRFALQGDRWLIYDVVIANVSIVNNYRAQFNEIIRTSSYQELVQRMKTQELVKTAKYRREG